MVFHSQVLSTLRENVPSGKSSWRNFFGLLAGKHLEPFSGEVSFADPEGCERPFAPHYEQHIRPYVDQFEKDRIKALRSFRKRSIITVPVAILLVVTTALMFITLVETNEQFNVTCLVFILLLAALLGWCGAPVRRYKSAVKEKIFPSIFSFFGHNFHYKKEGMPSAKVMAPSEILPNYHNEYTEDYIKGSYKDVTVELSEAKLTETTGTGKRRRTRTVFKGIIILLSMNKNFSGKTVVKRDYGRIGNWVNSAFNAMDTVRLEDPVFEKKFEVYSTDQVEARYLLTTSFMERTLELSRLFNDAKLECSFYDNKLLLMIPSHKNRFETASIFQPATFEEDINIILKEMQVIFQIIDILKLNERTGL